MPVTMLIFTGVKTPGTTTAVIGKTLQPK